MRLPRMRGCDPELRRRHLPFYLRARWLGAQGLLALAAQFLWSLTAYRRGFESEALIRLGAGAFAAGSSGGYLYARLGSRYLGASLRRIRQGKERPLESRLGKWTMGVGIAVLAAPPLMSAFFTHMLMAPLYSGAVAGMALAFFLWTNGLPR